MNTIAAAWIWGWWATAAALGAAGLWLALRGLLRDPGRGTRRCPRCWYGMMGVAGTVCPECGRDARSERRLFRRRRRWRTFAAGAALSAMALVLCVLPNLSPRQAVSLMPWTAVILLWPDGLPERSAIDTEIDRVLAVELRPYALWSWQRRMLARRCGRAAEAYAMGNMDDAPYALLPKLGPDGVAAVPALVRAGHRGSIEAIRALGEMGPAAIAASPDLIAMARAAPPPPSSAGPATVDLSTGRPVRFNRSTDEAALEALAAIDTHTPAALALFREIAATDALALPPEAIERLGGDPAMRDAILAAATDQLEAAIARGSGPHARAKDGRGVGLAVEALLRLGPSAAAAAPVLDRFIEASEGSVLRWRALRAVASIGPAAEPALPSIEPLRTSNDARDRLWACFAVASITSDPAAVDAIIAAVRLDEGSPHGTWDQQLLALSLLGYLRIEHAGIVPTLVAATGPNWRTIKHAAPAALGTRARHDPAALDALERLLTHDDPAVRRATANALGEAGAAARPALPSLRRARRDGDRRVAHAAAMAVERIRLMSPQN